VLGDVLPDLRLDLHLDAVLGPMHVDVDVAALQQLPEDQWVAMEELVDTQLQRCPNFTCGYYGYTCNITCLFTDW
jgi:hypothetical protein